MKLDCRTPFDWNGLVTWLGARAIRGVESVDDGVYVRGDVRVSFDGTHVHATGDAARVRRLFDLDADPSAIHATLGRDRMLGPLLRRRPGVRVPGAWDPFELTVRAIVGQQVSVAAARTILGRIAEAHGFDPRVLAEVTLGGMPRSRAETIRRAAAATIEGTPLERVKGIGPWTASYIAMRSGDADAFPAGDLVLRRAAGNLTERELLKRADAWRPHRAYAAMLLWMQ